MHNGQQPPDAAATGIAAAKRKVEVLTPDAVDSIRVDEVARSIRESVRSVADVAHPNAATGSDASMRKMKAAR